jgi:hypothetical protein
MTATRIVGLILVALGMVALLWGGIFWIERDTVLDIGGLEVTTEEREGVTVPRALGVVSLVAGIVLVLVPQRRLIGR